jgi:sugar lactone lactonase YvrE
LSSSIRPLILILLTSTLVFAEGTRTWEQSRFDDLSKGTAKGVAIRSGGGLELAPALKAVFATPSTYIWSIASDSSGAVFAATGAPARIYRITPDGNATIIFEPKELQVQAILAAKSGILYAATTPDGKVYRIEHKAGAPAVASPDTKADAKADTKVPVDASWTSSVFFEPGTRYIWDLALDASGNLFVATGDGGEIFKVTPTGAHSSFFKSDETHIRKLALDNKGNLIAGSDGSGLVYRISPAGEAFVLYSAAKKEITALAVEKDGTIYAAGVGEKHTATSAPGAGFTGQFGGPVNTPPGTGNPTQPTLSLGGPASPLPGAQFPFPGLTAGGGSEVYRIAPDGSPLKIWSSREDIVYALAFDQRGHLLAGTGNRGHVFALDGAESGSPSSSADDKYSDLLKATATQVTAFVQAPGGLYAATSNLGKLFLLGSAPEIEGTYESDIFDAHNFSRWGRVEARSKGNVEFFARSGNVDNPDRNWSAWKHLDAANTIDAPPARFLQWKAVLHPGAQAATVESVLVNYLPKNVAPQIDDITVQLGVHYQPLPKVTNTDITLNNNPGGQPRFDPPPPTIHDPDSVGVKWAAHDDNDDQLVYKLYYRGDGESRWLLLKENLTDKFYSFDASLLPDDGYTFKVVASDAPSHSPGDSLSVEKESLRVEIDTTPPSIENLTASETNGELHIAFSAIDKFSPIKRAEYSLDAGDWQFVEPVSKLSDSKTESYDFRVSLPSVAASVATSGKPSAKKSVANDGPVEHVVVVRVYDRYDNLGTGKYVVRAK